MICVCLFDYQAGYSPSKERTRASTISIYIHHDLAASYFDIAMTNIVFMSRRFRYLFEAPWCSHAEGGAKTLFFQLKVGTSSGPSWK